MKGFYKPDDAYRYFRKTDGKMLKGWQTLNKSRYFFDPITGKRYDNCTIVYKHRLFSFDSNGKLFKNGWVTVNGKTYYAGKNGELLTGWYTESGNTYYFNSAGERQHHALCRHKRPGRWPVRTARAMLGRRRRHNRVGRTGYRERDYRGGSVGFF